MAFQILIKNKRTTSYHLELKMFSHVSPRRMTAAVYYAATGVASLPRTLSYVKMCRSLSTFPFSTPVSKAAATDKEAMKVKSVDAPSVLTNNPLTKFVTLMRTYQKGVMTIFQNSQKVKTLKSEIALKEAKAKEAGDLEFKYRLSRQEFLLIHQSKEDIGKTIPFIVLAILLPESIPLVILKAPSMIPWPCWTEGQKLSRREKAVEERKQLVLEFMNWPEHREVLVPLQEDSTSPVVQFQEDASVKRMASLYPDAFDLTLIKGKSNLALLNQFLGLPKFGSASRQRTRLQECMSFLRQDDQFIVDEGLLESFNEEEVIDCCEKRGM